MTLLVYGSYGYTGDLVAREAADRDLPVVLAGRDGDALAEQAADLDRPWRTFALDDAAAATEAVADATAVLNCAGPFADTWEPLVDACVETGTHYLDVTGEWQVLEAIAGRDEAAADAGVMLLPGVGFDVVPTDCLAAHLVERLPAATELSLAFEALGSLSPGTAKTAVRGLGEGGVVRRDGEIVAVPAGGRTRTVDFGDGPRTAVTIPWGDVATAHRSTGIPDVAVYVAVPRSAVRMLWATRYLGPLLGTRPVQAALEWLVERAVDGPDAAARAEGEMHVWGEVATDDGLRAVSRLRTPDGYEFTARSAATVAERVLGGDAPTGFRTPSSAYGADLVLSVAGVEREDAPTDEVH